MLYLQFRIGEERYAIDSERVLEILPVVLWKGIPGAPRGVAGIINVRGEPVPLLDLSALATGTRAHLRASTRIVLVQYPDRTGAPRRLALLAEGTTATLRRDESDFAEPGVSADHAPYLGRVTTDGGAMVQRVEVEQLIPPEVRDLLFRAATEG